MRLRADEESLTEKLPYWSIQDGVVILNDGVYEVGIEFDLPSSDLWDALEFGRLSDQMAAVLQRVVPEGERMRVLVEIAPASPQTIRRYADQCTSQHPLVRTLHGARVDVLRAAREAGKLVDVRAYASVTYHAPGKRRRYIPVDPRSYQAHLAHLSVTRDVLVANFDRLGLRPRPMEDPDYMHVIWRYFNPGGRTYLEPPSVPRLELELPPELLREAPHLAAPTVRSRALSGDMARRWNFLWMDGHYIGVVSMEEPPQGETRPHMIAPLLSLPYTVWLVVEFWHDPYGKALRALEARARRLYAATGSAAELTDYDDPRARLGASEADQAALHAYVTGSHLFRTGLSVVLLAREWEEYDEALRRTADAFVQMNGARACVETAALFTQYVNLAPFSGRANERLHRVFSENAADLFPMSGPWKGAGRPVELYWNRWDGITAIDPYDPRAAAWNAVVVGHTGSGKTFFTQQRIAQLMALDPDVLIVDRGGGYRTLCRAFGGQDIQLDPDAGVSLNPFDLPEGESEPDAAKKALLVAIASHAICAGQRELTPLEKAILEAGIVQTYHRHTISTVDPATRSQVREFIGCRMSDLVTTLSTMEEVGDRPMDAEHRRIAREMATVLQHWTGDSVYGRFLDRPTSVRLDRDFVYFDTEALNRHRDLLPVAILIIADLVWRRVRSRPERPKLVVFDEAWAMLSDPTAGQFVEEIYRRFRKYGAAALTVTQNLADFRSEYARGIIENTQYVYILSTREIALAQEMFGLSDRAAQLIAGLTQQKGTFSEVFALIRYTGGVEGGVVIVRPTPVEYWLFTSDARDSVVRERTVEARGGDIVSAVLDLARTMPLGAAGQTAGGVPR